MNKSKKSSTKGLQGVRVNGAGAMGRFQVEFEVANHADVIKARDGLLDPNKVRRRTIEGVVDSAAALMVLPDFVVKELGLPGTTKTKVSYADGRTGKRTIAEEVYVELEGRHGVFTAVVEPGRATALIGAIVLESLDLLIDPKQQRLFPRDPKYIIAET